MVKELTTRQKIESLNSNSGKYVCNGSLVPLNGNADLFHPHEQKITSAF